MRRQPLAYPRWLYGRLRARARAVHGVELERYVLAQPPLGFSEFALGGYADRSTARVAWGARDDRFDERWARIFWSWGGIEGAAGELRALAGGGRAAGRGGGGCGGGCGGAGAGARVGGGAMRRASTSSSSTGSPRGAAGAATAAMADGAARPAAVGAA